MEFKTSPKSDVVHVLEWKCYLIFPLYGYGCTSHVSNDRILP